METLHVAHKVLHVENKEVEIIAKLQKASNKSHTTGVFVASARNLHFCFLAEAAQKSPYFPSCHLPP